jgi:hypothetical protein
MVLCQFRKNQVWVDFDYFCQRDFLVSVGAINVQNEYMAPTYLSYGKFHHLSVNFARSSDGRYCKLSLIKTSRPIWNGRPFKCPVERGQINITDWLMNFSFDILNESYLEYHDYEFDREDTKNISTEITSWRATDRGLQLFGLVKTGTFEEITYHSTEFVFNLVKLPTEPMIARVGDRRVGFFYNELQYNRGDLMFHQPYIIISRRDIRRMPWIYVIDRSIKECHYEAIRSGILSWNNYFARLGHQSALVVLTPSDDGYPQEFNIFDAEYNYVVDHSNHGLNGPYTGLSQTFIDYRSGEILLGNIYLNLSKVISRTMRYINIYSQKTFEKWDIERIISNNISWLTAHEIGHQLGLRHNFVGNLTDDGYGSVMDYIDFFFDFDRFDTQDYNNIRTYDFNAIKYGYSTLEGERSHEKHPLLDEIASSPIPFKTDENYAERIDPLVGKIEDISNVLEFIERAIRTYRTRRQVIKEKLREGEIDPYEYANAFLFIYVNRYNLIIDMLGRFVGGRIIDFTDYIGVSDEMLVGAMRIFLEFKEDLKYDEYEYGHLIYDFSNHLYDGTNVVKVKFSDYTYYGYNKTNLYEIYQKLIESYLEKLTTTSNLIRLNGGISHKSFNLLFDMSFCVSTPNDLFQIQGTDGFFPEIGHLLMKSDEWQQVARSSDLFTQYMQFEWIRVLSQKLDDRDVHYFLQMPIAQIFETVHYLSGDIISYLIKTEEIELVSHWKIIQKETG